MPDVYQRNPKQRKQWKGVRSRQLTAGHLKAIKSKLRHLDVLGEIL